MLVYFSLCSPSSRVHQHTCPVLQHLLYVLSDRLGHLAGLLPATFLQGKEAHRVERHHHSARGEQPNAYPINLHHLRTNVVKTSAVTGGDGDPRTVERHKRRNKSKNLRQNGNNCSPLLDSVPV